MFEPDRLKHLLEDRVTVGKGLEEPDLRSLKKVYDPRSLSDLIAWLETQPADRSYDWYDTGACLMCAYRLEACGISRNEYGTASDGGKTYYRAPFGDYRSGSKDGYHFVAGTEPWTMGAALERARSFLQANAVSGSSPILISEGV